MGACLTSFLFVTQFLSVLLSAFDAVTCLQVSVKAYVVFPPTEDVTLENINKYTINKSG